MLKPDKHLDPRFSVIHVGGLILKALKDSGMLTFDELLSILMDKTDVKVKAVYLPSLSFLFLLGKIQYHRKIDSFDLITS
jgi:hypothetical protein